MPDEKNGERILETPQRTDGDDSSQPCEQISWDQIDLRQVTLKDLEQFAAAVDLEISNIEEALTENPLLARPSAVVQHKSDHG
jgi:hypothetical protein